VDIFKCATSGIPEFYLIDTPGFDDSTRSDTDILREVASWLTKAYTNNIKLTGIIYLHRILDVRLGGSAMKNLRMFKKLCGADNLGSVVLCTTFWGQVDEATAAVREHQLQTREEFWGGLIARGSKMFRQDQGKSSGENIIKYLVGRRSKMVLEIQKEMVDGRKTLTQTAAGAEVQADLEKLREKYEAEVAQLRDEMTKALAQHDEEWQEEVNRHREQLEARIKQSEEDRQKMEARHEELWKQREAEREEERRQHLEERLQAQREVDRMENELAIARMNNLHLDELQSLRNQLWIEQWRVAQYQAQEESCIIL